MIIKKITIKNFKSFGNNEQIIELNPQYGELILLSGRNGAGKSSIPEAIDYCLFNKVKGKKKKHVVLSSLPNRLNNNLYTSLEFVIDDIEYKIERGMNPNKVILYENHAKYNRTGSKNVNKKIEDTINIDLETFKSFISMSINDFKNFMTLSPDEKRTLLDKLFNLGVLNDLVKILKNLKTNNEKELIKYDEQAKLFEQNIESFQLTIDKIKEAQKSSLEDEINTTREEILSKKEEFLNIQNKINKIKQNEIKLKDIQREENKKIRELEYTIREYKRQLDLYANDKCPVCGSDLQSDEHLNKQDLIKSQKEQTEKIYQELLKKQTKLEKKENQLRDLYDKANKSFGELKQYLSQLKTKLQDLKNKQSVEKESQEIVELLKNIEKNEKSFKIANNNKDKCIVNQNIFKKLDELFSDNGIKKSIISSIIKPINKYIDENLSLLDMPFKVTLNDQFNATITLLGNEVDVETLSTGETKKVNISIMLAYLKMIRMKRKINVLFLDEIFSSIDIEGINAIIHILKRFAREWNVNVFLVHHSYLDKNLFDRILHVEKNITSYIQEERIKNVKEIKFEIENDFNKINNINDINK